MLNLLPIIAEHRKISPFHCYLYQTEFDCLEIEIILKLFDFTQCRFVYRIYNYSCKITIIYHKKLIKTQGLLVYV